MMETNNIKTIKVLPIEEMFFLKKIDLDDSSMSDVVCYARRVSRDYRLVPEENIRGEHLYFGYKESEYPCDELDREILKQLRNKFPQAAPHTSLIMFNAEKDNNRQWIRGYNKQTLHITIVYTSIPNSSIGADAYQKKIEVLSLPIMREHQRKLNTDVCIVTDNPEKYRRLCSLLDKTYELFSKVC